MNRRRHDITQHAEIRNSTTTTTTTASLRSSRARDTAGLTELRVCRGPDAVHARESDGGHLQYCDDTLLLINGRACAHENGVVGRYCAFGATIGRAVLRSATTFGRQTRSVPTARPPEKNPIFNIKLNFNNLFHKNNNTDIIFW